MRWPPRGPLWSLSSQSLRRVAISLREQELCRVLLLVWSRLTPKALREVVAVSGTQHRERHHTHLWLPQNLDGAADDSHGGSKHWPLRAQVLNLTQKGPGDPRPLSWQAELESPSPLLFPPPAPRGRNT